MDTKLIRSNQSLIPSKPCQRRTLDQSIRATWVCCGVIVLACIASGVRAENPPNVVVFLADDQGWGDLSVHGNGNIATPHIDSLAKDGVRFDNFFVCAVCAPTRAEFLTGRYHARGNVRGVSKGEERLDTDVTTIADTFKAAGYATGAFGKWHNGTQYPYHPNGRGFDEYYGFCSGHWGNYFAPVLEHNGQKVQGSGYITDDLTTHAMEFIEQHRNQPFFCYLPYCTPHSPMQVPDRFYDKFDGAEFEQLNRDPKKEDLPMTRAALAMCENIDWNVGCVLEKLDELNLSDNTIVVYFSDNGPNSWRWNDDMKGRKGSVDEGGLRVPCLVRWPGHIPAGLEIETIGGAIDLLPTLADLAGIELIGDKPLDGVSLKPLFQRSAVEWKDRILFSMWRNNISVRTQQYRMDPAGKLFDMTSDPGQRQDISKQQPKVAARLRNAVTNWKQELASYRLEENRPYPVGYSEFPTTVLPARDGTPSGSVERSSRAPNCSYFTNWTNTGDAMTWDVDIHQPGIYRVEVFYTCPAADVGSTFQLSLGETLVQKKITEAHDPPLRGAENDRASRGSESFVKTWKPIDLGTVRLSSGRGDLTLQATDIPGKMVADVRGLRVTLVEGSE